MFMQLLVNGLVTGSVYAIAAVGVSLVYGILRLVNFAYGDMMTFGAFAGYFANITLGLPMLAAAAFAMVAVAVLSVALDGVRCARVVPASWASSSPRSASRSCCARRSC